MIDKEMLTILHSNILFIWANVISTELSWWLKISFVIPAGWSSNYKLMKSQLQAKKAQVTPSSKVCFYPPKAEGYRFGVVCLSVLVTSGWNFMKLILNTCIYDHSVVMQVKSSVIEELLSFDCRSFNDSYHPQP